MSEGNDQSSGYTQTQADEDSPVTGSAAGQHIDATDQQPGQTEGTGGQADQAGYGDQGELGQGGNGQQQGFVGSGSDGDDAADAMGSAVGSANQQSSFDSDDDELSEAKFQPEDNDS